MLNKDGEPVDVRGRTAKDAHGFLHYPNEKQLRARKAAGKVRVGDHVTVLIETRGRRDVKQGMYPGVVAAFDEPTGMFLARILGNLHELSFDDWFSLDHYRREWVWGFADFSNVRGDEETLLVYQQL